jgi:metal-dependent hydrolase (beta-lactamase superfamily II)
MSHRHRFGLVLLLCVVSISMLVFAQKAPQYVARYLELKEIGTTPAEIILSPDYQTIIEFQDLSVETASSGRADQITVELDEQMIRIRANRDVVNTDLTVVVGGKTALFILRSDASSSSPRRYIVQNK